MLESDLVGCGVDALLKALPRGFKFGRALRIGERGGIEDLAMHAAQDVAKRDLGGRFGEEVAAVFAAQAFDDLLGFQFDEDLNEVICRDALAGGELFDAHSGGSLAELGQTEDRAGGVIAFDRQFHRGSLPPIPRSSKRGGPLARDGGAALHWARLQSLRQIARAAALIVASLLPSFASIPQPQGQVLLVVGAPGEPAYADIFAKSEKLWREAALKGGAQVETIGLAGDSDEDRTQVEAFCKRLAETNASPAWIVLIGHGTDNGKDAKFNARGPDISAAEFGEWLKPAQRPLVFVNTTSASGRFLKALAGTNRVVITATRSGGEVNFARFGGYMAEAIGALEADFDKDGQTSLLEAYLMAARKVADFYKDEGRLATEHALLDDNGDGNGTPPDWFQGVRTTKKAQGGASVDGRRAHQIHLVPNDADRRLSAEARARRDELELEIAKLRDEKEKLQEAEYYNKLEALALEIARIYEASETQ